MFYLGLGPGCRCRCQRTKSGWQSGQNKIFVKVAKWSEFPFQNKILLKVARVQEQLESFKYHCAVSKPNQPQVWGSLVLQSSKAARPKSRKSWQHFQVPRLAFLRFSKTFHKTFSFVLKFKSLTGGQWATSPIQHFRVQCLRNLLTTAPGSRWASLHYAEVAMENGIWFSRPFWAKVSLSLSQSLSFA